MHAQTDVGYKALQAKIKELQRKHTNLSETLGNLEAHRLLKELNEISYRAMALTVHKELLDVEQQLQVARAEMDGATNGKKWSNWLKEFGQEIAGLDKLTETQKKSYLEGLVRRIDVRWNEVDRQHELTFSFYLPIVDDGITKRTPENFVFEGVRPRKYDIYEGSNTTTVNVKKKDGRG